MANFGWAHINCSASEARSGSSGPAHSLQFVTTSNGGSTTGSHHLLFYSGSSNRDATYPYHHAAHLILSGNMIITGTLSASQIRYQDVVLIDSTGSTFFGNDQTDQHGRTGSLDLYSDSARIFGVDVVNSKLSSSVAPHFVGAATFSSTVQATGSISGSSTGFFSTGLITQGYLHASGNSLTINATQIDIPNVAAGTDNTVVLYNGSTLVTDEIDSRVFGSTLVDGSGADNRIAIWTDANTLEGDAELTYDGDTLQLVGHYSSSLTSHVVGAATFGSTVQVTGSISGSTTLHSGGAATFGSTVQATGSISGSSTLQAVGDATIGGALAVSGNIDTAGDLTAATITMTGFVVDADGDTNLKSLRVDDGSFIGCDSDNDLMRLTTDLAQFNGAISGSTTLEAVGNTILGANLTISGTTDAQAITATTYSGSSTLQVVGNAIYGGNIDVSGTVFISSSGTEALRIGKAEAETREIVFENAGADKVSLYMNSAEHFFIRQEDSTKDINIRVGTTNVITADGSDSKVTFAWPIHGTSISGSSTLHMVGNSTFGGTVATSGSITAGSHILPATDNSFDLGSGAQRWANIFTGDLHLKNERGDWTIVEEEEYLCVINNKTGKKYKMGLIPLEEDE